MVKYVAFAFGFALGLHVCARVCFCACMHTSVCMHEHACMHALLERANWVYINPQIQERLLGRAQKRMSPDNLHIYRVSMDAQVVRYDAVP